MQFITWDLGRTRWPKAKASMLGSLIPTATKGELNCKSWTHSTFVDTNPTMKGFQLQCLVDRNPCQSPSEMLPTEGFAHEDSRRQKLDKRSRRGQVASQESTLVQLRRPKMAEGGVVYYLTVHRCCSATCRADAGDLRLQRFVNAKVVSFASNC